MTPSVALNQLFDALWADYVGLAPHAHRIHALIGAGRPVPNDHVAFRGLARPGLGIEALAEPFLRLGYTARGEYRFEAKKLYARHFETDEPGRPRVFVSELLVDALSPRRAALVDALVARIPPGFPGEGPLALAGRPWAVSSDEYRALLEESEYAAWVAAFGFRVNHFTVAVHEMPGLESLQALNARLRAAGFALNEAGGEVKGTRDIGLEQSSTLAGPVEVAFSDGRLPIPGVYYEFARRHVVDGTLYSGFVTSSADKIFESTDVRRGG